MAYVDGFVIPMPKSAVPAYRKIARKASKVWIEHGALQYVEAVGDDMDIKQVKSFLSLAKAKRGETVVFAWILYKSKAHRNAVNKKVIADPRIANFDPQSMPFDMRYMAYSGFKVIVQA